MPKFITLSQVKDEKLCVVSFGIYSELLESSDPTWRYRPSSAKSEEYEAFLASIDHQELEVICDTCGRNCKLLDPDGPQIIGTTCVSCDPVSIEYPQRPDSKEVLVKPEVESTQTQEKPQEETAPRRLRQVSLTTHFLKQSFRFAGRSSRSEFLIVQLVILSLSACWAFFLSSSVEWLPEWLAAVGSASLFIYALIASTSVSVRRLHDFDRSGLWAALNTVPLLNLVMFAIYVWVRGSPATNSFGPADPPVQKRVTVVDAASITLIALLLASGPAVKGFGLSSSIEKGIIDGVFFDRNKAQTDPTRELPDGLQAKLEQEPCSRDIHRDIVQFLRKGKLRRSEAELSERWATECTFSDSIVGGYFLGAARAWNTIGEPEKALTSVEKLLQLMPDEVQGLLTSASTLRTLNRYTDSVSRYERVFSIVAPSRLAHSVYMSYVDSLEKLGQGCAAYDVYRLMLDENPPSNIADVEMWMGALEAEYKCLPEQTVVGKPTSSKVQVLSVQKSGVALINLEVNGVKGTFVFDTGATKLALTTKFAAAAGIENISDEQITVKTANGEVRAHVAFVNEVKVEDVSLGGGLAMIMPSSMDSIGQDGLFGMNFISRFKVEIEGSKITLIAEG